MKTFGKHCISTHTPLSSEAHHPPNTSLLEPSNSVTEINAEFICIVSPKSWRTVFLRDVLVHSGGWPTLPHTEQWLGGGRGSHSSVGHEQTDGHVSSSITFTWLWGCSPRCSRARTARTQESHCFKFSFGKIKKKRKWKRSTTSEITAVKQSTKSPPRPSPGCSDVL